MKRVFSDTEERMGKTVDVLANEYMKIRAGRANPSVLDKISVDYYGVATPINQVASISTPEARVLAIQPWDISLLGQIERAIQKSDIGINPQNDGKVVRLVFPQLTEEKREEIVKDVKKMAEDSKVAVRSIRRNQMDKINGMKKDGEITEDDLKSGEKKIQSFTDNFIKEIDSLCENKSNEVRTV